MPIQDDVDVDSQPPLVRTFFGPTEGWRNVPEAEIIEGNNFLALDDTPDSYAGHAGHAMIVNALETGTEMAKPVGKTTGIYDVRDYGAVGDGVADDTVAIQATVDAALSSLFTPGSKFYGRVYFPVGSYKLTSAILVTPETSGNRGIIFEGCGSASYIFGDFADFLFRNTFLEPNYGINVFRDLRMNNANRTVGSGCISWNQILQGGHYYNLDLDGFCCLEVRNFEPAVNNCSIGCVDGSHLAKQVGIKMFSGGGGSITNCVIRSCNHGVRCNGAFIYGCDIESNMMGVVCGTDPFDESGLISGDGYGSPTFGGSAFITSSAFEANTVAIYQLSGTTALYSVGIISDAFCSPLKALLGGVILTGHVTQGSPIITNIAPNTNELQPGQFLKNIDDNGTGYIVQTVDSASQVTLTGNWNNGTDTVGLGRALFGERLSTHAIRIRHGNAGILSSVSAHGPFSEAVVKMENPGNETFINPQMRSDGGSGVTWDIPFSFGWTIIGDNGANSCVPIPESAYIGTFNQLPTTAIERSATRRFLISDCNTTTFNAIAGGAGSGADAMREVRWNSVSGNWRVCG